MEGFLKKIQEADSAAKRRMLVIGSAVAMVVVLYVWLAYFNNLIADAGLPAVAPAEVGKGAEENVSFWKTMQRGSAIVYDNVAGGIGRVGELFKAPREYIVKPMK